MFGVLNKAFIPMVSSVGQLRWQSASHDVASSHAPSKFAWMSRWWMCYRQLGLLASKDHGKVLEIFCIANLENIWRQYDTIQQPVCKEQYGQSPCQRSAWKMIPKHQWWYPFSSGQFGIEKGRTNPRKRPSHRMAVALCMALRLKRGGCAVLATVCSTWVFMSRSVTERSQWKPLGNRAVKCVEDANVACRNICICMWTKQVHIYVNNTGVHV